MRRSVAINPADVVAQVARGPLDDDEVATRILDAAADLYARVGVRRVSVEEIAEHGGVGRTTLYRRFEGRQQILEAVIAREVRRFFASIVAPSAHLRRVEDVVVESFVAGLTASETSLLATLVRSEPELLTLLTIDGGPIVEAARSFLVTLFRAVTGDDRERATLDATVEILVRLAISLVLTPSALFPSDDPGLARTNLHRVVDPLVAALGLAGDGTLRNAVGVRGDGGHADA